jgi:stress-induced morphogen
MDTLEQQVLQKVQLAFGEDVTMDFHDERWDGKHFYVDITSHKFIGKSRIDQSKMVYEVLDEFMQTGCIHALRMKCRVPNNNS